MVKKIHVFPRKSNYTASTNFPIITFYQFLDRFFFFFIFVLYKNYTTEAELPFTIRYVVFKTHCFLSSCFCSKSVLLPTVLHETGSKKSGQSSKILLEDNMIIDSNSIRFTPSSKKILCNYIFMQFFITIVIKIGVRNYNSGP